MVENSTMEIRKYLQTCHSKERWDRFIQLFGADLAGSNDRRLIRDIFRRLNSDNLAHRYNPKLFCLLIETCLRCNDTKLGVKISDFCKNMTNQELAQKRIAAYLQANDPESAKNTANRFLALRNISENDALHIKFELINIYATLGSPNKAKKILKQITQHTLKKEISESEKMQLKTKIARIHFFTGDYKEAVPFFLETATYYERKEQLDLAARLYFNAGVCILDSDFSKSSLAIQQVEKCKKICEQISYDLPIVHVEIFLALFKTRQGRFAEAKLHLYKALGLSKDKDSIFLRIHMLSVLTMTCNLAGNFSLAKNYAKQALKLSVHDKSGRYKSRYVTMKAELYWHEGQFEKALQLLETETARLTRSEIKSQNDFETFNLAMHYRAYTNQSTLKIFKMKLSDDLKNNVFDHLDFLNAHFEHLITAGKYNEGRAVQARMKTLAQKFNNLHHMALAACARVKLDFASQAPSKTIENSLRQLSRQVDFLGQTHLRNDLLIGKAALNYRSGNIHECRKILQQVDASGSLSPTLRPAVETWLRSFAGKTTNLSSPLKRKLVARATQIFFQPTLMEVSRGKYQINQSFFVDLSDQPLLEKLFSFLLLRANSKITNEHLLKDIWQERTNQLGWEQKIRNSISRLRKLFAALPAPIVYFDGSIQVNTEMISIQGLQTTERNMKQTEYTADGIDTPKNRAVSIKERRISDLLQKGKYSSLELSEKTRIPLTSLRRDLNAMIEKGMIAKEKSGRKIKYYAPLRDP